MMIKNKLILLVVLILLLVGIYYLTDGKVLIQEQVPEESTEVTSENETEPIVGENPEGEANPDIMTLDMTEWNWISALYNDGTEIKPKSLGKFKLTFNNDGTFSASTDCNGIGGKYVVAGNQIFFADMMSTLMFCEGSQETDFRKILENTSSFFFTNRGELILELKYDSGTATFR